MKVICENCSQQYRIDENKLGAATNRFKCKKCSHFVIIVKPETILDDTFSDSDVAANQALDEQSTISALDSDRQPEAAEEKKTSSGIPILSYLSVTFLVSFLIMAVTIVLIYWRYVPALVNEQTELRTSAISKSFSGAVKQPLLVRNYLRVNQEAERISKLPGVAYASVINKRNIVIAGVFSKPSRFEPVFLEMVKKIGFPKELARKNNLNSNTSENSSEFTIGGQPILDVAISLGEVGGEVHVGLFVADIQKAVKKSLTPMLITIAILFILGLICFSLLAKTISRPINDLRDLADKISMGEVDQRIVPKGPREIRNLGRSLDRMRASIRTALKRM